LLECAPECMLVSVACVLKERPAVAFNIDCCSFNATMYVMWTDAGMQAGAAHDLFEKFHRIFCKTLT